jgi:hypothetical protein
VRWWPSVYLDVKQLAPGDTRGVGQVVDLYTKGWLPYTLRWQFRVTAVHEDCFPLVASGDFVGLGIWTLWQDRPDGLVKYDWKILAEKPLLRDFLFIMKPIFEANHRWALAKDEDAPLFAVPLGQPPCRIGSQKVWFVIAVIRHNHATR